MSITGNATSVAVGATVTLGATATNASGGSVATTFTWTSANPMVALVGSSTGVVTGVAVGSTTITASAGGQNGVRVISVTAASQPPPPLAQATIEMPGAAFSPNAVSIVVGGTVTFVFTALPHNVFFGGGAGRPADIPVTSNQVVQRTFTTAGLFNINCTLHPGMSGVITVQ
ncbi:MAG: Ig-like domain-containing protein [Gemmatimonadota bacterium]|nr:Ig-like domain-containing protein [Gemmatimonadota bacterium]